MDMFQVKGNKVVDIQNQADTRNQGQISALHTCRLFTQSIILGLLQAKNERLKSVALLAHRIGSHSRLSPLNLFTCCHHIFNLIYSNYNPVT